MTLMEAKLDSWKRQLRRQKKKLSLQQLDALSTSSLTLADVTKVVDNVKMWGRFDRAVKKARAGEDVEDLKFAMGACAIAFLYKNWQRQGVVMNMLEYQEGLIINKCLIVSVNEHKTGSLGPAKVTIDNQLMHRINAYQRHIRPHMSPSGEDIPQLFILPGGKPIKRFATIVDYLPNN